MQASLTVSITRTLNINDYENVRPMVVHTEILEDDADKTEEHSRMYAIVLEMWLQQAWWELWAAFYQRQITKGDTYLIERQIEAIEAEAKAAGATLNTA